MIQSLHCCQSEIFYFLYLVLSLSMDSAPKKRKEKEKEKKKEYVDRVTTGNLDIRNYAFSFCQGDKSIFLFCVFWLMIKGNMRPTRLNFYAN